MTWACLLLTLVGLCQTVAGWWLTRRFARALGTRHAAADPITVLKPLHGDEPRLSQALATLCAQDYPPGFQIVFGVAKAADTALPVVAALRERFPHLDIALVIDGARHGANPKVGNLINMLPAARHDILVIADSDVYAQPDYLRALAAALAQPGVGLATALYTGLPSSRSLAGRLGATAITHGFLPGALLARALGRRDCLGATMALRRDTLRAIGGLESLRDHLADDNVLGRRVRALGLDVALARTVVATTVPERTLSALWRHELRWSRTIRTLEPAGFAASILQYPLVWAGLAVVASGGARWAWGVAAAAWLVRALAAAGIDAALARGASPRTPPGDAAPWTSAKGDSLWNPSLEGKGERVGRPGVPSTPRGLGLAFPAPLWLLPARDFLSAAEWAASHLGRRVEWRGSTLRADTPPRLASPSLASPRPDPNQGPHAP